MSIINQHEFGSVFRFGESETSFCTHCGATSLSTLQTCINRQVIPEPQRRTNACDDIELIYSRIQELRLEKNIALNTPSEEQDK